MRKKYPFFSRHTTTVNQVELGLVNWTRTGSIPMIYEKLKKNRKIIFFSDKNLESKKYVFEKISKIPKSTKFENPEITEFWDFSKNIFSYSRFFIEENKIFEKIVFFHKVFIYSPYVSNV